MAYTRIRKVLIGLALLTGRLQNVSGLPAALFEDASPRSLTVTHEETGVVVYSCEAPTTTASSIPAGFSTAVTTVDSESTTGPSTTSPTTLATATVTATSLSGASANATCEGQVNACVGDVTHWDGGLGACGNLVNTNTTFAVALPFEFMGTLSNNNPYCGRSITLYNPVSATTSHAVVQDKCMGCVGRALDCTDVLFDDITDNKGNGRMSGIEWWFD